MNEQQTSRLVFISFFSSHVVDRIEQGPAGAASDPSFALGSLKDLLPALAALAPAGASRLVDALLTWYHQHRRAVAAQTGSAWHARVLELAFWHAAHGVLSPLPPRALPTRDVALVADAAFEAILNTTAPAPPWDKWGSDAGDSRGRATDDGERGRTEISTRDEGTDAFDDDTETRYRGIVRSTERAGGTGTERASRDDAYPDAYARRVARARDPAAPARLCPSPPASELAARCLGLASRHDPAAAAEKFARELAPRTEGEHKRAEAHAVIYGARYLRARETAGASSSAVRVGGEADSQEASAGTSGAALRAAATTLRLLNPVSWAPSHRKSDLRHALCALLRGALAPAAGARLPERAPPEACAAWAEAVSECRADVAGWIRSKEKKHAAAGLPLLGALHAAEALCGGGSGGEGMHAFMDTTLLKALREGKHRAPAVDALRAVIEGIAPPLPERGGPAPVTPPLPAETGARLRVAMAAASAAVKRTSHAAPADPALVTAVTRAVAATARVDPLLAADVLLDLTREAKVSDALAAGLAALPDVLALTARRPAREDPDGVPEDTMESLSRSLARDASADASAGWSDRILGSVSGAASASASPGSATAARAAAAAAETASSLPRELRKRLSGAARALQTANPADEGAAAVATALLRCAPFAVPEEWRGAAAGEAVPPLCAHPHAAVRRAAAHAVRRVVVAVPAARDAIAQQLAAVMLRAPTGPQGSPAGAPGVSIADADVAAGAAGALRGACAAWRRALAEASASDSLGTPDSKPPVSFDALRPEAACLLLLCSPSARARGAAAEALGEVAALSRECEGRLVSVSGRDDAKTNSPHTLFSALESCAGEMLLCALDGSEGFEEAQARGGALEAAAAAAAAAGGFAAVARHVHGSAWTSALGVVAARAAAAAPEAATTARAQALQRVQLSMLQEGARVRANAPRAPTDPNGDAFELWRNLACFVCAAGSDPAGESLSGADESSGTNEKKHAPHVGGVPDNPLLLPHGRLGAARATPLGARGSQSSLFALLVPCLREGGAQAAAAAAVLARVPPPAAPRLLAALAPLQAELAGGGAAAGGGTPFDRRSADRELRAHLARLHLRLAVSGAVEAAARASPRASTSDANETRRTPTHPASPPGSGFDGDANEFSRDAVAARLAAFVDGSLEYARSTAAGVECGPDELARVQFAAAAVAAVCAPTLAALAPGALTRETRARWWARFAELEAENEPPERAGGASAASVSRASAEKHGLSLSLTPSGRELSSGTLAPGSRRSSLHGSISGYPDRGARSDRSVDSERDSRHSDASVRRPGAKRLGALDARLVANTPYARWGGGGSVDALLRLGTHQGGARGFGGYGETDRRGDPTPTSRASSLASMDSDDAEARDFDGDVGRISQRVSASARFAAPARPTDRANDGSQSFRTVSGASGVTALTHLLRHTEDPTQPASLARAAREAMASLLVGPAFDAESLGGGASGGALRWIERRLERDAGGGGSAGAGVRALRNHLRTNPALAHTALDGCYHAHEKVAAAHVSALSDLYAAAARSAAAKLRNETSAEETETSAETFVAKPSCPPAKLVALVLFKLVHPSAATREDAVALLRAVIELELGGEGARDPAGYKAALPELADEKAHRAFQLDASAELAERRPDLGEFVLVEALERLAAFRDSSRFVNGGFPLLEHARDSRVLGALTPWVKRVHLPHIAAAGRAERLLRALYSVTASSVDRDSSSAEALWFGMGKSPRNVVPLLRFLETKGLEDVASAHAMAAYCRTAKRACAFLARAAPQHAVDQLVYAVSLRGLEAEYPPRAPRARRRRAPGASVASADDADARSARSGTERSQSAYSLDGDEVYDSSDELQEREELQETSSATRVSAPDLAIVLLAEVAAEHAEAFRAHLPVLLHAVTATLAGSPEPTVRAHCRQLLANLTRALAARGDPAAAEATSAFPPRAAAAEAAGVPDPMRVGGGWRGEVGAWETAPSGTAPDLLDARTRGRSFEGGGHLGRADSSSYDPSAPRGASGVSPAVAARGRAAAAELRVLLARRGADGTGETGANAMDAIDSSDADDRVDYGGDRRAYDDGDAARADDALGGASWSPEAVARLVGLLPDALFFERGLREQWADEARRWLLRAASFPLAAASARVLAALRVPLDADAADTLLAAACASAAAAEGGTVARGLGGAFGGGFSARTGPGPAGVGRDRDPGGFGTRRSVSAGAVSARSAAAAADLAGLLLDTLTEMFVLVEGERETVAFAHVFWGAAACLRTMHVPTYARAARLLAAIAQAWPLDDPSGAAVEILRAAAPAPVGTPLASLAPAAVFADARFSKRFRGAKTLAAAAAAAAHEAWLAGTDSPERFARIWALPPPPATPAPAMRLADLAPLLLKGLARPSCAAHALRALAAIAPAVGVGDAWGGERALALVTAGLLPAALAAAAAAAEAAPGPDPARSPARSAHDAIGVGEGVAAGRWCAAGLRAAAAASRDKSPRAAALAAALEGALPGAGASLAAPRGRRTAPPPPAARAGAGPDAARGASAPSSSPHRASASSRVVFLADAVADPLFRFVAPKHVAAVAKTLVDVAVAAARAARRAQPEDAASASFFLSETFVSACLELLIRLVARASADPAAKAALMEAPAGGAERGEPGRAGAVQSSTASPPRTASSAFAPAAALLEGPHSAAALELLRRVAELGEGERSPSDPRVESTPAEDALAAKYGAAAWLGAPSAMWNSVDANGGRAVDLMYGVAASGRIDPNQASPPACLVGDSAV